MTNSQRCECGGGSALPAEPPKPCDPNPTISWDGSTDFHGAAAAPAGAVSVPGFAILSQLGRGGTAAVYKAWHLRREHVVALKIARPSDSDPGAQQTRFRMEAEALVRARHPGVVQLYECGEHDGLPFLVLEYVGGGSLADLLQDGPLPARGAATLLADLAQALHCIHRRGVIHRDLKPANVLLTAEGAPKLADFGLSRCLQDPDGPTQLGTILGTPSYMAPELAHGWRDQIGPETDVFGLGAVLYEALTGRPPYRGRNWRATLKQARRACVVPPRHFNRGVPRALERICLRALAADPAERYASAAELEAALEGNLRRSPWLALGMGLAAASLGGALAWVW